MKINQEIVGGAFIGDEERELARDGGTTEREALRRRLGQSTSGSFLSFLHSKSPEEKSLDLQNKAMKSKSMSDKDLTEAARLNCMGTKDGESRANIERSKQRIKAYLSSHEVKFS